MNLFTIMEIDYVSNGNIRIVSNMNESDRKLILIFQLIFHMNEIVPLTHIMVLLILWNNKL